MPNQVASANIVADSSVLASAGLGQPIMAFVTATSQVSANGYVHVVVSAAASASASLLPNPLGNYKGTTARLAATSAVAAAPTAMYAAQENIEGSSAFTTWVILSFSGTLSGSGTITASPVRVLFISGTLSGHGFLDVGYEPAIGLLGSSNLSATATRHRGVTAEIAGSSEISATATLNKNVVPIVAGSSLSAHATTHQHGTAIVVADSTLAGSASTQTVAMVGGSTMSAQASLGRGLIATIEADSSLDGTATVPTALAASAGLGGSASVAASAVVLPGGTHAFLVASSSVAAHATLNHGYVPLNPLAPIQTLILGAQFAGAGTLRDALLISLTGTLSGAGAIQGVPGLILTARPLPMVGSGTLFDSTPLPMVGFGNLVGDLVLQRVPRPFCPPRPVKTFRWGYTLTQGDLELQVCDDSGNPFGPVVVLYSFYQIVRGGQRMIVGPANRRPVEDKKDGKPGRYYATGTAGELGQPGEWVVVWRYQRSWWTPTQFVEQPFRVLDEVTSGEPGSLVGRCRKFGWL